MKLTSDIELANTYKKLCLVEEQYEQAKSDHGESEELRDVTLASLQRLIDQLKEQIAVYTAPSAHRPLTADESRILDLLSKHYGPSNNIGAVFFTNRDHAVICAKDRNGVAGIIVNLSVIPVIQKTEGVADHDVFNRYLCPR